MTAWRPLTVQYAERATKDLRDLERSLARRVRAAILRYAETGHGDVKRLQGSEDYRLRVGHYRVRFEIADGVVRVMIVLHVRHRSEAYK